VTAETDKFRIVGFCVLFARFFVFPLFISADLQNANNVIGTLKMSCGNDDDDDDDIMNRSCPKLTDSQANF